MKNPKKMDTDKDSNMLSGISLQVVFCSEMQIL